jgi:hypothetical protein
MNPVADKTLAGWIEIHRFKCQLQRSENLTLERQTDE